MASIIPRLVFRLAIFTIVLTGFGSSLRIITEPQSYNELTDNEINITCLSDGPTHWARTVTAFQIMKQDQQTPVVSITHAQGLALGPNSKDNAKAYGHLDKDASKSFLTLSIHAPDSQDAGVYRCKIFYFNENFQLENDDVLGNLTFTDPDITEIVADLVTKVSSFKITVLEQSNTIQTLEKQLITLENAHSKQKQHTDTLKYNIKEQNKQINQFKDYHSTQKQRIDILTGTIEEQNKRLDQFKDYCSKQKQHIDSLNDKIGIQNDTIVQLHTRVDRLDLEHTQQQQQRDIMMRLIQRQNQTIHTLIMQVENLNKRVPTSTTPATTTTTTTTTPTTTTTSTTTTSPTTTSTSILTECPDESWTYYKIDKTCLKFFGVEDKSMELSWFEAREACKTYDGDLVQIRDEDKNNFVFEMFGGRHHGPWIGVRNNASVGFDFKYVDGSHLGSYHPWKSGDPSGDKDGDDKCVFMFTGTRHPGRWGDADCSIQDPYVCSISIRGVF